MKPVAKSVLSALSVALSGLSVAKFVIFAVLCVAWAIAMWVSDASLVQAAGAAWFTNWTVQISVTLLSWAHPFELPNWYYEPWRRATSARMHQLSGWRTLWGLSIFEAVVRQINPFSLDRRSFETLDAAMRAAETTHAITFVVGGLVTVGLAVAGAPATAAFLTFWNVILNLYAIALQRHNRGRIRRHARRRAASERPADPTHREHRSAAASSSL